MSHYSKIFDKVPLEVQNRSGFDLSHENLFTATCGTLVPAFVYDCIPNTKITLGVSSQIQLPPMSTDFYGKVDAVFESFFVPYRLLYGGWQELITHPVNNAVYPSGVVEDEKPHYLPKVTVSESQAADFLSSGSLYDYLGGKSRSSGDVVIYNVLRFIAYHKIWDDWYRNSFVQKSAFQRASLGTGYYAGNLPYISIGGDSPAELRSTLLADNYSCLRLRQRNWAKDYFTTATPLPQAGSQASLVFDPLQAESGFTWGQLSAMNSLQRWMQRNNIAGYRYSDQILARFGCLPPDSIMDRSIYLGRKIIPVYTKSVYKQGGDSSDSNNPFTSIGTKFGSSMGVGEGSLINRFHAKEHGIFMVLFSLVPRAYYSSGQDRVLTQNSLPDFPDPDFAHLGDQPIFTSELFGSRGSDVLSETTFGYTQKDAHYKYKDDQVHGLLRDGESLEAFALQRSFSSAPILGSEFLQIPKNFMDQVTATDSTVSKFGCWVDAYFSCKASMPLPAYSIPTLTDPKDVHTVMVSKGGRTL